MTRNNVERCGYCGRFQRYENDIEFGERWVCSNQSAHIIADPEHWSVLTYALEGELDIQGEPIQGELFRADLLTTEQLRRALGVDPESTDSTDEVSR
jgi:hypothetical protein